MGYNTYELKGVSIVELNGSLDLSTSDETRNLIQTLLDKKPSGILMDLSGLRYLKSSGYQVLFELAEKSQATGIPTALVGPIKEISTIMKIFRLDSLYPMYETLAEAIDDMGDK